MKKGSVSERGRKKRTQFGRETQFGRGVKGGELGLSLGAQLGRRRRRREIQYEKCSAQEREREREREKGMEGSGIKLFLCETSLIG